LCHRFIFSKVRKVLLHRLEFRFQVLGVGDAITPGADSRVWPTPEEVDSMQVRRDYNSSAPCLLRFPDTASGFRIGFFRVLTEKKAARKLRLGAGTEAEEKPARLLSVMVGRLVLSLPSATFRFRGEVFASVRENLESNSFAVDLLGSLAHV
jgi:hypothetical protein